RGLRAVPAAAPDQQAQGAAAGRAARRSAGGHPAAARDPRCADGQAEVKARALAGVLVLAASPAWADDPAMHAAADGFYGAYKTFHPSDGIPDAKGRARYQPFLSP